MTRTGPQYAQTTRIRGLDPDPTLTRTIDILTACANPRRPHGTS